MTLDEKIYTINDLEFIKLLIPSLIPRHLVEQVKGRAFSVDKFYSYIEECVADENPYSLIYAIVDPDRDVVGYLWIAINPLEESIFINTLSVDKKYWKKGEIVKKAVKFLKNIAKLYKLKMGLWMTTNPRFYEKLGFKRSKDVAMQYMEE